MAAATIVPRTKLEPPPARPEHIARPELLARLSPDTLPTLTVVAAPAGYGKSILLGALARRAGDGVVGWLSLDEDDADPARFWDGVASALSTAQPSSFRELEHVAGSGVNPRLTLVPLVVEEASALRSPLVLILDDYHRLGRSDVHEQLSRFIALLPRQLRLVVASRADPPLPLGRLRAAGELGEVRAADLRFTDAEAAAFLNDRLALELSPAELTVLVERAEGWPAALYLAALSIRQLDDRSGFIENIAGTNRFIVDYLGAEVLAQLPQEQEDFLLRCSVLGKLTGPLVDHVLERVRSASMLHELEHSNLLVVPLDDDRRWYRLHHLFADLLRAELHEREPGLVQALNARASSWLGEHGFVDEAIEHAIAASDTDAAAHLIAVCFWPFLQRGQVATVQRWLRALPQADVAADPRLCIVTAWVYGFLGRPAEIEKWLDRASCLEHPGSLPEGQGTVEAAVSIIRAGFGLGDVSAQARAGRLAVQRDYEDERWSWIAEGCLGIALFWSGEHAEASMRLERVVPRLQDVPQAWTLGQAYLALIELESGDRAGARARVERAFEVVRANHLDEESDTGLVHLTRGKALALAGELEQAEADLKRAAGLLSRGSSVPETALAQLELAHVLERSGQRAEARARFEDAVANLHGIRDTGILEERLSIMRQRLGIVQVPGADGDAGLTARELEILAFLPGQLSQREIGAALFVSFNTVSTHVKSIYRKLGARSRREAVDRARELEIL